MPLHLIFIHGGILSGLITVAMLFIIIKGPRIMLQDYPKEIQDMVPPKSKEEKKATWIYGAPFLMVAIGGPALLGWHYLQASNLNFVSLFVYVYGLLLVFNVYDLIILDWLLFCTITPRFVVIPGTEGSKGYKNYRFHFVGFLKGFLYTLVMALVISSLLIALQSIL
ncbi:hypothetical protein [Chryseolinea lacunae]|uniref:DUF1772 domain-containing protein n=1 Tax=Chryseolinea lacunae TaxID=2801331 RepID=A0ABS1L1Q0_9BACT|nr:hypothetical protein [Chryseolinea lacunae]MBL0745638.1 hypothetical protein [Chryseolinea lacunae]